MGCGKKWQSIEVHLLVSSGELTFCHGKSPFFMGKSTISMAIFNCFLYVHQRVSDADPNKVLFFTKRTHLRWGNHQTWQNDSTKICWLVVSTPLENIIQLGLLSQNMESHKSHVPVTSKQFKLIINQQWNGEPATTNSSWSPAHFTGIAPCFIGEPPTSTSCPQVIHKLSTRATAVAEHMETLKMVWTFRTSQTRKKNDNVRFPPWILLLDVACV